LNRTIKRLFDVFFSCFFLILLSPIFIFVSMLIKLDSPGPVFYKGMRVGLNGRLFKMLKFRTMVNNAEKIGGSSTPEDDPRITRVGRLLRRFKLDELPQLINVCKGEMSFVGPRPQVQWAVDLYSIEERQVLNIKPGITSYASIKFYNEGKILKGSSDPDKYYLEKIHKEKMRLNREYIMSQSIWLDIKIILKTFALFFKKEVH